MIAQKGMRSLAAVGLLLVSVAMSCGVNAPRLQAADEPRHNRTRVLPAGSIVLPDSLGGVAAPSRIALNPTDNRVYVCGGGVGVAVIDAATGMRTDLIPAEDVVEMQYNPVANVLYLWSAHGGSESHELTTVDCTTDSVVAQESLTLWPICVNLKDNKLYAAIGKGRTSAVAVLDGQTRRLIARVGSITPSEEGIRWASIVWNPTNDMVYYNDGRGAILVIDGRTDREVARVPNSTDLEPRCANPRSNKLYASSYHRPDSSLAVIDCRTNRIVAWLPVNVNIADVVYNAVENKLYCSGGGGLYGGMPSIVVIDGEGDTILKRVDFLRCPPGALCYDSLNNRVYCFGSFGGIAVIDCRSDSTIATNDTLEVDGAVFSVAANRLYCLDWSQGDVYAVNGSTFSISDTVTVEYEVMSMLYNRQQDRLYCPNSQGHALAVIDCGAGRVRGTIEVGRNPNALACAPDGKRLYCANEGSGSVSVIDCESDRVVAAIKVGGEPTELCLSPTARRLFCGTRDGYGTGSDSTISVIGCRTHSVIRKLPGYRYPSVFVCDSVNGRLFCATNTGYDGTHEPVAQIGAFKASSLARDFSVELPGTVIDMVYDPVLDRLYVGHAKPNEVSAIDCRTGTSKSVMKTAGSPRKLISNPHQHKVYVASVDLTSSEDSKEKHNSKRRPVRTEGSVEVVDTNGDSLLARIEVPAEPSDLLYVPEVNRVYCACAGSDTVVVIDCATDRIVDREPVGARPVALTYSPRHGVVYVANSEASSITPISISNVPNHR
jgi:YVTN family beta-propeller protein